MYKSRLYERKNDIASQLIHEQGISLHIHWLNPLLLKRKNK